VGTLDSLFCFLSRAEENSLGGCALGGPFAALFYAEATCFFDVRVCRAEPWPEIHCAGIRIGFYQPEDALEREAISSPSAMVYGKWKINVMRPEYLIAFSLRDRKSPWGYCPSYFAPEAVDPNRLRDVVERAGLLPQWKRWQEETEDDNPRFATKKRWHEENARLPLEEKVRQLLQLQREVLPLIAERRPLKWWEKPWDIEA